MQNITAIFTKFFKERQKRTKPLFGADAYDDWKKLMIIFLSINVLILLWSGYLFFQINQGNIFAVPPTASSAVENSTKNNLSSILNIYDGREKHFEDLRSAKPASTDPAI